MLEQAIFEYPRDRDRIRQRLCKRSRPFDRSLIADIQEIFDHVAVSGDAAVREATARFDQLTPPSLRLPDRYVAHCVNGLTPRLRDAIQVAIGNIRQVNQTLMPPAFAQAELRDGTIVGEKCVPLDSVGLWVPARKGPLVSTALMLTVPATVAGVRRTVVAMPPTAEGLGDPVTVAAASLAGADEIVVGNGVAVIAAMAVGTDAIAETDAIYGPGPNAIAAAMSVAFSYGKRTVVGIGPTEAAIVADGTADPRLIAWDLASESEHGPDSSCVLASDNPGLIERVAAELTAIVAAAPEPRKSNLMSVFGPDGLGALVRTDTIAQACDVVDGYAPEHLLIVCAPGNEAFALDAISNAAEILLGPCTPFSAANYAIGITAVLPTNGFAGRFSGITCRDMLKYSSCARLNARALSTLLPTIEAIGEHEGLPCHVQAARARSSD